MGIGMGVVVVVVVVVVVGVVGVRGGNGSSKFEPDPAVTNPLSNPLRALRAIGLWNFTLNHGKYSVARRV